MLTAALPIAPLRISLFLLGSLSVPFTATARANGAFPEVSQLVADPSDPAHLVLRSNFGLLTTRDSGRNWDLVCEAGIGYQNTEPPAAVLGDGTILLALPTGIAHGDASACNFGVASGPAAYIADVSRVPSTPARAVAVGVDVATNVAQVWQSETGDAWSAIGTSLSDLNAATLDVAADDANIVYISGTAQSDTPKGVLARSTDAGQTWVRHDVPGANKVSAPYIAAVSATDHDTVYVRLSGVPGHLLVTHDGGEHFDSLLDFSGPFDGFALSPDGRFALASGRVDGVWRAPTSTLVFERLSCAKLRCLSWSPSGLFACADEFEAGFLVGESQDQGGSFEPALHLSCVRGPLACAPSSTAGAVCTKAWPAISEQLGTDCASASSFTPSTQCRDAGISAGDASAPLPDAAAPSPDASVVTDAGSPSTVITPVESANVAPHGGCGCRVAGNNGSAGSVGAWLSLLTLCIFGSRHAGRGPRKTTMPGTR